MHIAAMCAAYVKQPCNLHMGSYGTVAVFACLCSSSNSQNVSISVKYQNKTVKASHVKIAILTNTQQCFNRSRHSQEQLIALIVRDSIRQQMSSMFTGDVRSKQYLACCLCVFFRYLASNSLVSHLYHACGQAYALWCYRTQEILQL